MAYLSGTNKVSGLVVDTDLNMGAHSILLNTNQKVDGVALESFGETGAVIDYVDSVDKELDNVVTPDSCSGTAYENVGTPYTVTKADMDVKTGDIKVTLACEIHSSHGSYACVAGYNIDGGGDVQIGTTNSTTYVAKSATLIEVAVGEVIQFRLKEAGSLGHIQNMVITQTHAGRKTQIGYY